MNIVLELIEIKGKPEFTLKFFKDVDNNKGYHNDIGNLRVEEKFPGNNKTEINDQESTIALSSRSPSSSLSCENTKIQNVLVAEPEADILLLYQKYLENIGFCVMATEDGKKALKYFLAQKAQEYDVDSDYENNNNNCNYNSGNEGNYDLVILNTHLAGKSGLDVAKEIRKKNPRQRIIIATTTPIENLPKTQLKAANINKEDILTMPFRLPKLVSMIKGQRHSYL